MADAPVIYKKLPGVGSGALARHRLWEGPDHLLVVTSWPSGEGYKRFFFRDIQAIVIRQTSRRTGVNIALFILSLLTAGPFFVFGERGGDSWIPATIVGGIWLVFIIINSLLGPTCETRIQTAVQTESITSLVRLRTALKVLARIQPHIVEAQTEAAPLTAEPAA